MKEAVLEGEGLNKGRGCLKKGDEGSSAMSIPLGLAPRWSEASETIDCWTDRYTAGMGPKSGASPCAKCTLKCLNE